MQVLSEPGSSTASNIAWVHWIRVAGVIALALLIPPAGSHSLNDLEPPTLDQLPRGLPWEVAEVVASATPAGFWELTDAQGVTLGYAARTMPQAASVAGYRGSSEAVLVIDPGRKIIAASLLNSVDTPEHVREVSESTEFFAQFVGWTWGDTKQRVDAVSGATLTSLALAEGILARMGVAAGSLVFAHPITLGDVQDWFPEATELEGGPARLRVLDRDGQLLGEVVRTGPLVDDLIGYQGPSELLLRLSAENVEAIKLLHTFDNEPYVDWIRQEKYYWKQFTGKSIAALAQFDLDAQGIEGISGATMSSVAMTETLIRSASALASKATPASTAQTQVSNPLTNWTGVRWYWNDSATVSLLILLWGLQHWKLFHARWLRRIWLIGTVLVIGFYTHNLLSLALLAGWSVGGVAWKLAPGLTILAAVSILLPPLRKSNPYCNHLCPHGALQQLIRPKSRSRRRISLGRLPSKILARVPGVLLTVAYLLLVLIPVTDLSRLEPFHAYVFQVATFGSILFCLVTLVVSATIPMAYCRFGCPTGFLIDYIRRRGDGRTWRGGDAVIAVLLVVACVAAVYRS